MTVAPIDDQVGFTKTASFMVKVMEDAGGAVACGLCALGDRLGLFKELNTGGPATSMQLAQRTRLKERYVREWLSSVAAAGYLEYHPRSRQFLMPVENAPILAQGGPMSIRCVCQHLPGLLGPLDRLVEVLHRGDGIRSHVNEKEFRAGLETVTAGWYENRITQWLLAIGGLQAMLEGGADVADIGCGSGRALISMALSFPKSRFVGYELFGPFIARASANAEAAGVADRVRFEQSDIMGGLPESYDLITSFDLLYDVRDPLAVLRAIRSALRPSGIYILVEIKGTEKLAESRDLFAEMSDGTSLFLCAPTASACAVPGLTHLGLTESKLCRICAEAGFSTIVRLPFEDVRGPVQRGQDPPGP